MGRFPFGPFAYTRLDERMKAWPEWNEALEKNPGVDPMNLSPNQPHIECEYIQAILCPPWHVLTCCCLDFSTELYGGGPQHTDIPRNPEDVS